MLSLEGKQLGNYDVIRRIRLGGMGAVYEGRQRTAFGRRVAIKVILGDYATDRKMRQCFAREARTIARLQHAHILPLIEFGDANGILYLVMPFIEGGTLTNYLRRALPDLSKVTTIFLQLLDAVEYAHDEGLVHRDIKSSNVLLEMRRSGLPHIYLADFGLVRILRQVDMEDTEPAGKPIPLDQVPGTPHYMAPEQTRGIVTPLTDIYALGVLLHQLLTGELPYQDSNEIRVIQMHLHAPLPSPSKHDVSIPPELDNVVQSAMAKRPEERYRNVAALRTAFLAATKGPVLPLLEDAFSDAPSPTAEPPPPPHHPAPPAQPIDRKRASIFMSRRMQHEGSRRLISPLLTIAIVPIILLVLLITPRVLGVSIFPSGFPIFGTSPVATIYVTAQSKIFQDSYVLTASPQVKTADLATHTIPDRIIKGMVSDSIIVRTTGTQTIAGKMARGNIEIANNTDTAIKIPAQQIFTSKTGIQVRLTQDVQVPPRENAARIIVAAIAVNAGADGNIAAHTLDSICCNNSLMIRNPAPFFGGVDGQSVYIVVQADLEGAQKVLTPRLQQQIAQQLQRQLATGEAIADPPAYKVETSSDQPVGAQVDQVQVTIKSIGNAIVYNRNVASKLAGDLLSKNASQKLGKGYQQQGRPILVEPPTVVRQGKNGIINLSVAVRSLWVYELTQEQMNRWLQAIGGSTIEAAQAFLQGQPGVNNVQIQLPFGTDRLPTSVEQIKIKLVNNDSKDIAA
jgi:serine/threonine protein kinase